MKLYSWLRALLIFMVMSAVLTNIIPPRYEGSYKVVMRLIFLMILLKPVLLLLFNEEYITDRVNTLYNDYSKTLQAIQVRILVIAAFNQTITAM
ncbi:MAG: hypothetical protein ACLR72_08565 [Lachnospira pectinoschiza]